MICRAACRLVLALVATMAVFTPPVDAADRDRSAHGSAGVRVVFREGRLSIDARMRPWAEVLTALQRATGLAIHVGTRLEGLATATFADAPIEHGLRQLFGGGANLVIVYEEHWQDASIRPTHVWLLPPGQGLLAGGSHAAAARSEGQRPATPPSPDERLDRIRTLAEGNIDETLPELLRALEDSSPEVRIEALETLGGEADERSVGAIVRLVFEDGDGRVRAAAVEALGQIGTPTALVALEQALRDTEQGVRSSAVEAIAEIGGPDAVSLLRRALQGSDDVVRIAAGLALADIPDDDEPPRQAPRGGARRRK